ncbi:tRNA dihydrouridine(20/20a) synthase DusA [Celeribacter halophilus]|uniref:tRNA dihydrouridine(20/20a) synthase DusA n=1 Tax=Celeribacter halophilus TaxID=576117 RepID=UPI001C08B553|nr:tRNA dihydrouridine(20/20a) synthase DusA [Celeribacter halophilus]MBU2890572.1 tRNA dihydrouridine(20/20a) synthase DusA [Celeribacter halophilus]MDO6510264.1 tRNA dihydrouridine(20/20a) synthase DusA [Celeribacter halophilus]
MVDQKEQEKSAFSAVDCSARLSVAPMMDWTDHHCRYFHRLMSRHALLYTEMVTAPALVRGGAVHLLDYNSEEHPVAVQLGGSDPAELAAATGFCVERGYDEVNLNVGCPSDRVQSGAFGAVLMKSPDLVADCVRAMQEAAGAVPVTVKCRIGVDDQEAAEVLPEFLRKMQAAGVGRITVHARKAWLDGLSPKENRDIPPLDYPLVHEMKRVFPDLHLSINGGIASLDTVEAELAHMDGVMVGRAAYHQPYDILGDADQRIFGDARARLSREDVVFAMEDYIGRHVAAGGKLAQITKHMLGLFAGQPGARRWKRVLSEGAHKEGAGFALVQEALPR